MNGSDHAKIGLGFGVAATYAAINTFGVNPMLALTLTPLSIAGAKLPDIDHDKTQIGKKRKAVTEFSSKLISVCLVGSLIASGVLIIGGGSELIASGRSPLSMLGIPISILVIILVRQAVMNSNAFKWATAHRGFMHTLFIPAFMTAGIILLPSQLIRVVLIGLDIGYLSHLFADMLTIMGCPILFPLTTKNIHILNLTTSNYKNGKNGKRKKKKVNGCKIASYIVAIAAIILSLIFF